MAKSEVKEASLAQHFGSLRRPPSDSARLDPESATEVMLLLVVFNGSSSLHEALASMVIAASRLGASVLVVQSEPIKLEAYAALLAGSGLELVRAAAGQVLAPRQVSVADLADDLSMQGLRIVRGNSPEFPSLIEAAGAAFGARCVAVALPQITDGVTRVFAELKKHGALRIAAETPSSPVARGDDFDCCLPINELPAVFYDAHDPHARLHCTSQREFELCLPEILSLLRDKTGHDFGEQRSAVLTALVQRSAERAGALKPAFYIERLRRDPRTREALFRDLLAMTPRFFRDEALADVLEKTILPALFAEHRRSLRAWVVGCGAGEEAYGLAMLLCDYVDRHALTTRIQVFATDAEADLVRSARRGVYTASTGVGRHEERVERFFTLTGNEYHVGERLRRCLCFSVHDLQRAPGFSRLDLIVSRDVLGALPLALRGRVHALFGHGLDAGGFLVLDAKEGLGGAASYFVPVDAERRAYRRIDREASTALRFDAYPAQRGEARVGGAGEASIGELVERALLTTYSPAAIVVNEDCEAVYFHGQLGRYLEAPQGPPNLNVLDMIQPPLLPALRSCLHLAMVRRGRHASPVLRLPADADAAVRFTVAPFPEPSENSGFYLIVFHDEFSTEEQSEGCERRSTVLDQLEESLQRSEQRVRQVLEDARAVTHQLRANNEELRSHNEELLSSSQELEALVEELRVNNRELVDTNARLNRELEVLQSKVQVFVGQSGVPMLLVDDALCILRFSPAVAQFFAIRDSDQGRPLADIAPRFHCADLHAELRGVLFSGTTREVPIQGLLPPHVLRIARYDAAHGGARGLILSFIAPPAAARIPPARATERNHG